MSSYPGGTLRQQIESATPLIVPGIYDGISARALAATDFTTAYVGSHATSATMFGLPDVGYLGRNDMVDQIRRLAPIAGTHIIADGEGGFGSPLQVAKTVREYENAGASAIHIEDHTFGKHLSSKWDVAGLPESVDRVKAALDARHSDDFLIIARTDSFRGGGIEPVLERLHAFAEQGADAVWATGTGTAELATIKKTIGRPLVSLNIAGLPALALAASGVDIIMYFGNAYFAAQAAIAAIYSRLSADADLSTIEDRMLDTWTFDTFLGIDDVRAEARRFGLIED